MFHILLIFFKSVMLRIKPVKLTFEFISTNVNLLILLLLFIMCVLCTMQFLEIGRVSSMQVNHKPVEKAVKGQDVCIKVDPVPGEAPKMYGRHFEHTDLLVSKVGNHAYAFKFKFKFFLGFCCLFTVTVLRSL